MDRKSSLLLLAVTIFNLIYNAFLPLHPDEAYYWTWSRHLELSYFDHPPMVAYLIKMVTFLSSSEFAIRLVSVVCITIAAWVIYLLAKKLFSEKVADITLLILLCLPATQGVYSVVTPDAPLMMFWALTVYCLYVALWEGKNKFFYLAGVFGGCLLLSKYTGVLLFPAVFLFLATTRFRKVLGQKHIYLSLLLALAIFSPVIIWNYQHDWVSFRFQLIHGMGGEKMLKLSHLGDFLAGQALVANPIFMLVMLYYAIRYAKVNVKDEKLSFMLWPFVFTFLFFLYGALSKKSEANWALPAYLTGVVLLSYWVEKYKRKWTYYTGIALTLLMVTLVKFPEVFPNLPKQAVMKRQFTGYREIYHQGRKYTNSPGCVVLSDTYQRASEAWYYLGVPETYILSPGRVTMYNFWRRDLPQRKNAIYFGKEEGAEALRKYYSQVQLIDSLHYDDRYGGRDIRAYRCSN